jgi:Transposase DDE domain group 1
MIEDPWQEGTCEVKRSGGGARVKVSADGKGVVSHAGAALLRELAAETGLAGAVTGAGYLTGVPGASAGGQVFAGLAVAIADGADAVTGIEVLRDRGALFGPVASMPTAWRLLDRIDEPRLERVRAVRAAARERAWRAGAAPERGGELRVDFDATISTAHGEKQNAAATWKKTFGFHPLLAFLDRPEVVGGEGLAGLLRPGNAGSNTAADHVKVLDMAVAALPGHARPRPGDPSSPRVLARCDSAGATHVFAAACREQGAGFSFGFPVDQRVQQIAGLIPQECWHPAVEAGGRLREGAWVAEATGMIDLSSWPEGSRLILRKERPHPGAQLTFADADGHRITAFLTDTGRGVIPGQIAGLELRHRQHARVEDRIREAKASGLRNLPCRAWDENCAWLEAVLAAADLICWAKLICFAHVPSLARCEIPAFRYRVLHAAAQLTRSARQACLRIDRSWRWPPRSPPDSANCAPHSPDPPATGCPAPSPRGASLPASSDPPAWQRSRPRVALINRIRPSGSIPHTLVMFHAAPLGPAMEPVTLNLVPPRS